MQILPVKLGKSIIIIKRAGEYVSGSDNCNTSWSKLCTKLKLAR